MRLINVKTQRLEEFFDEAIPEYAILSHTWGADEVLYNHVQESGYEGGSDKIDGCCAQARKDGLDFVWIDTCCIDKSSSAELSEAINSMFEWYRGSAVCYAYLADVADDIDPDFPSDFTLAKSRWFTRGWTLQELLAPRVVVFYSKSWQRIGRKEKVENFDTTPFISMLSDITDIPVRCLDASTREFRGASVAQKMSWAAGRKTTRKEDRAYSLMGMFGVNMPMLYGEGHKAFIRLQEEILRVSDDHTILAWGLGQPQPVLTMCTLLASSPDDFARCGQLRQSSALKSNRSHFTMTNRGLQIELGITDMFQPVSCFLARLDCFVLGDLSVEGDHVQPDYRTIFLPLCYHPTGFFYRDPRSNPLEGLSDLVRAACLSANRFESHLVSRSIYIARQSAVPNAAERSRLCSITCPKNVLDLANGIRECYPPNWTPTLRGDYYHGGL